jgi:hypothetical protein
MNELEKKPETAVVPGQPAGQVIVNQTVASVETPVAKTENKAALKTVTLKYPFKAGDRTLSEVTFSRRPKARDLIMHVGAATAAAQELHGIAALIGVIPEDLMDMDGGDYLTVQKVWADFLTI